MGESISTKSLLFPFITNNCWVTVKFNKKYLLSEHHIKIKMFVLVYSSK
jgi:hypothetical protein